MLFKVAPAFLSQIQDPAVRAEFENLYAALQGQSLKEIPLVNVPQAGIVINPSQIKGATAGDVLIGLGNGRFTAAPLLGGEGIYILLSSGSVAISALPVTVRAATTGNITIATALNNGDSLDGVTLATGDVVLVKNQSTASQNGLYTVGATPARVVSYAEYDDFPGVLFSVQEGTANADTLWLCTSNKGGTLDTTALNFSAPAGQTTESKTRQITAIIDGGGSAITTGCKGFVSCPWTGTITGARLLSSDGSGPATSGSIVIDVWKDTYANFPPTVADTITASAKPTLSSAIKSDDTALTGWTTAVAAGDIFGFNVDSCTSILRATLQLTIVLT